MGGNLEKRSYIPNSKVNTEVGGNSENDKNEQTIRAIQENQRFEKDELMTYYSEKYNNVLHMTGNKNVAFFMESNTMNTIYEQGFQTFVQKLEGIKEAFHEPGGCLCCMDEGIPDKISDNQRGVRLAGSGILHPNRELLKHKLRENNVTEITSHDGCGAAGLYAKANNLDPSQSDEYGRKFSQELATEMGLPYRHISKEDMIRNPEYHNARVTYFDTTGKLDPIVSSGLPRGFVINRKVNVNEEGNGNPLAELEVSINIAFGHHGFGELFTEENPFVIVPVISKNDSNFSMSEIVKEIETVTAKFGKRVRIDGFEVEA